MPEGPPPSVPVVQEPATSTAPAGQTLWRPRRPSTILGGLLILLGAVLLIGQFANVDVGHYGWPFFVIVPGLLIIFLALTARGFVGEGLAIAGAITTVSGLILLYQNSTDHFESWAYAWALVFPAAVGAGMILYGLSSGRPANVRAGTRLLAIGGVLFLLGAAFFEGVIGIGGYQFGHSAGVALGALIIFLGGIMLLLNLTSGRRNSR